MGFGSSFALTEVTVSVFVFVVVVVAVLAAVVAIIVAVVVAKYSSIDAAATVGNANVAIVFVTKARLPRKA